MLEESLKFLKLLRDLEKVERTIYRSESKKENDVEHSYQVAMMSWFLSDQFNLKLSKEKLLMYGLVHDLIEVYAGDTPAYFQNHPNSADTKKEREEKALVLIREEVSNFKDLLDAIEKYEHRQDKESVFVYEVDKLVPLLNLYLDDGYGWNKLGLTLEQIKKEKRSKITSTKELVDLLEEALRRCQEEEEKLFEKR